MEKQPSKDFYPQNSYHQQHDFQNKTQAPAPPPYTTPPKHGKPNQIQHFQRYVKVLQLPMFPLSTDDEDTARQKEEQQRQQFLVDLAKQRDAGVQEKGSSTDTVGLNTLDNFTRGMASHPNDTLLRPITNLETLATAVDAILTGKETLNIAIFRWASPPEEKFYEPVVIDVLEMRALGCEENGGFVYIKTNRDIEIRLGGQYEHKVKTGDKKYWSKSIKDSNKIEVVENRFGYFPLEMVLERRMPMTAIDWGEITERFRKRWVVPSS